MRRRICRVPSKWRHCCSRASRPPTLAQRRIALQRHRAVAVRSRRVCRGRSGVGAGARAGNAGCPLELKALNDQIAVAVYRQAEAKRAAGDAPGAVDDFLRIVCGGARYGRRGDRAVRCRRRADHDAGLAARHHGAGRLPARLSRRAGSSPTSARSWQWPTWNPVVPMPRPLNSNASPAQRARPRRCASKRSPLPPNSTRRPATSARRLRRSKRW